MHHSLYTRVAVIAAAAVGIAIPSAQAQVTSDAMECRVIGKMSLVFRPGTTERQKQAALNLVAPFAFDGEDFHGLGAGLDTWATGGLGREAWRRAGAERELSCRHSAKAGLSRRPADWIPALAEMTAGTGPHARIYGP